MTCLVDEGLTIGEMATRLSVSPTTVRYWLGRYGLQTRRSIRLAATKEAREAGSLFVEADCATHGAATLVPRPGGGFRCLRCRNEAVRARRRRVKELLVAEAGGACVACGYSRAQAALQFHHRDPTTKAFAIAAQGVTRSLARAREEAAKCVLLCANCHAEVEAGVRQLPSGAPQAADAAPDPG